MRRENVRPHGRDDAVDPGHAGAHRDQREHVEVARHDRLIGRARRTASRPTAPPASRARTGSSSTPSGGRAAGRESAAPSPARTTGTVSASADPEPARHVGKLGIGAAVGGHHVRLERHAADRAAARPDLADLGMHRTGVDRAFRHRLPDAPACRRGISPDRRRIWCGIRPSRNNRTCPMRVPVRRGMRIDRHAADGIDRARRRRRRRRRNGYVRTWPGGS